MEPASIRIERCRRRYELTQLRDELRFARCTNGTKCLHDPTWVVFDPSDWSIVRFPDGQLVSMCDRCARLALDRQCAPDLAYVRIDCLTIEGMDVLRVMWS